MTLPNRDELRALRDDAIPPCVTLYMPTHRGGYDSHQDPIRYKNLVRHAEEQLTAAGASRTDCDDILGPARRLVDDAAFWQSPAERGEAMVLFAARGKNRHLRLPETVREMVIVNERFHLGPLLATIESEQRFHILALSQKSVRLFEADRDGARELALPGVPRSVQAALHYDVSEHSQHRHSGGGAPQLVASRGRAPGGEVAHGGHHEAQFHGHGVVDDDAKKQVLRFMQVLAEALGTLLHQHDRPLPMVLAGVEYELAMFRDVSKHPRIAPGGIEGNPDLLAAEDLRARAWPLAEPMLRERARKAAGRYEQLAGTDLVSNQLEEILLAAVDGRVDSLFFDPRTSRWGTLDVEQRRVELHPVQRDRNEDLAERAAAETFFHGGCVYSSAEGQAPGNAGIAAVFRY